MANAIFSVAPFLHQNASFLRLRFVGFFFHVLTAFSLVEPRVFASFLNSRAHLSFSGQTGYAKAPCSDLGNTVSRRRDAFWRSKLLQWGAGQKRARNAGFCRASAFAQDSRGSLECHPCAGECSLFFFSLARVGHHLFYRRNHSSRVNESANEHTFVTDAF